MMNFLDIIFIMIITSIIVIGLYWLITGIKEKEFSLGFITFLAFFSVASALISAFLVVDKRSGVTIGKITSVDKNFFGTTALYLKTSETEQEKYCIEDTEIAEKTKNLLGEYVEIYYGERIGLYSTGKCHTAPITEIEVVVQEKESDN